MSFRSTEKLFRKTMNAIALDWPNVIGRIPNAVKEISSRTTNTPRTIENWLQGRAIPNGNNVITLMSEFAEVADAILEVAKINQGLTEVQKRKLLEVLGER